MGFAVNLESAEYNGAGEPTLRGPRDKVGIRPHHDAVAFFALEYSLQRPSMACSSPRE